MTRKDIENLAQVSHSERMKYAGDESGFDQLVDRFLWAIRASHDNPRFDEQKFRGACRGDGFDIFPRDPVQ